MDDDFIQIKETKQERVYKNFEIFSFIRRNENSENPTLSFINNLNNEIKNFLEFLKPTNEEIILRKFMTEKIKNIIIQDVKEINQRDNKKNQISDLHVQKKDQKKKRNSKKNSQQKIDEPSVHCFGSYETGLFLPGSDIDMTLFTENTDALRHLQYTLSKNPLIFSKSIIFLSKAKIPILRFMDICHFRYDLCLNQETGLLQTAFIKKELEKCPNMKYFIIFIKYFLKTRELNESRRGGLFSYAQIIMIMNFFNLHPMIQKGIKILPNLAVLLLDFFQLYGQDFSYQNATICFDGYKPKENSQFLSIEDPVCYDDIANPNRFFDEKIKISSRQEKESKRNLNDGGSSNSSNNHNGSSDLGYPVTNMSAIKDVFFNSFKIMSNLSKYKLGDKFIVLPLWIKIGKYELNWRQNVQHFYEEIVVKNRI
ncbi:DNA polymerase sigma [Pseudoloma neurophilia]|uniref:polynucleotide adenylyltransferase n=1 Tax=Pseudoloma neurophilia TaxID=146866 RepID=A0A0R0LT08_9MICR|nr:DNA polymerase sigma [Pseudoloma neurophilia]